MIQNETVSSTTTAKEHENEQDNISIREKSEDILEPPAAVKSDTLCPSELNLQTLNASQLQKKISRLEESFNLRM